MLGPALALGSSVSYGVADFLGGTTSRRIGTLQFIFYTQLIGLVLAIGWIAIGAEPVPPLHALAAAAGAGIGMTIGLGAFFEAMVVGRMSIVAPVSATGVVVPIAVGIIGGEHAGAAQAVGIVAAFAGVLLAARPPSERHSVGVESGLGLALLSAVGVGLFLWLMAPASRHGAAWAVLLSRAIPALALVLVVAIRQTSLRAVGVPRMAFVIFVAALLAFAGTALYALATRHGQLLIVSVLGSLYPVVTVMLAYRVLGERVHGAQRIGVVAVLVGVVLLSV